MLSDMADNQRDRWKNGKRFASIPEEKIKILWIIVGERKAAEVRDDETFVNRGVPFDCFL